MTRLITLTLCLLLWQHTTYALIFNKENPVYYFTNHEEQINDLKEKLHANKIVGITGITGMGKSELAKKYVQDNHQEYEIIAFLDANVDLVPQFTLLAKEINQKICLTEGCYVAENPKDVKRSLMEYLKSKDKWLLVFDNLHINENDKIKDIIDWRHNGHIIICSQDDKYLLAKVPAPYFTEKNAKIVINKIMKNPPEEFIVELVNVLNGYPAIIGHSALLLQNNNFITIQEYIRLMKKNDNKVKAHLEIVLNEISKHVKEVLYQIALLNNQKVSRRMLEQLFQDKEKLSDNIQEIIRFGLIEQISEDRENQIFSMHDAIKDELLETAGDKSNQSIVNLLLDKTSKSIPELVNNRITVIQDDFSENNLEVLLDNAQKYDADIYKVMELREKLLWYYLIGKRRNDNAKKMVDWFQDNRTNIKLLFCNDKQKASYVGYLTFIGTYEYTVANSPIEVAMEYLDQAEKIVAKISGERELKAYIYSIKALMQVHVGDIINAKENIEKAAKARPLVLTTFLGAGLVEYNKAKIFIAEGKYQEALDMVLMDVGKTSKYGNNIHLAPDYITQAMILNYMKRFQEAHDIIDNDVYSHIKNKKKEEVSTLILSQTLTELSRAELGLDKKEASLTHSTEAVDVLVKDEERKNGENNLENSKDAFLASALVAKADALAAVGKIEEAMKSYRIAKNIYWNIYGTPNIGRMDNVSYLFANMAKTALNLPDKTEGSIECNYFYKLLIKFFGKDHPRSFEVEGICH